MKFNHVVLTRFNVRLNKDDHLTAPNNEWLKHRFDLFKKFCFPTMCKQTNQNFFWYCFFDSATPDIFRKEIEKFDSLPFFNSRFTQSVNHAYVQEMLKNELGNGAEFIITTRLDNDDAVCSEFIELIQNEFEEVNKLFINFDNGLAFKDNYIYTLRDKSNPFISLIERLPNIKTVWSLPHNEICKSERIKHLSSPGAWLQIVHDQNVTNRIKGRMLFPRNDLLKSYNINNIKIKNSILRFIIDLTILYPIRKIREFLIGVVKKMLGSLGLNNLKNAILKRYKKL